MILFTSYGRDMMILFQEIRYYAQVAYAATNKYRTIKSMSRMLITTYTFIFVIEMKLIILIEFLSRNNTEDFKQNYHSRSPAYYYIR